MITGKQKIRRKYRCVKCERWFEPIIAEELKFKCDECGDELEEIWIKEREVVIK